MAFQVGIAVPLPTNMNTLLILGDTGFIGGAVKRHLAGAGYSVLGASSRECNLLDLGMVRNFLRGLPDGALVIFCSGITRNVDDSYSALSRNIQMVQNFVDAARGVPLGGVVYLSSTDVYGPVPKLPITEESLPAPANYYGISKLTGEFMLQMSRALDCPITVLRLPGVYGPGDAGQSVVGRLLTQIQSNGRVTIYGDGSMRRDFVEVGDLGQVVRRVIDRSITGVLNVATGTSLTIKEVVETLSEAAGQSPAIDFRPADTRASGDLVFDISALHTNLPGLQFQSLSQGSIAYVANLPWLPFANDEFEVKT